MNRLANARFIVLGGSLLSSLFLFSWAWADTITLKNNKEIKGLVVEKHADRILLSTEKGEIPVLLSGIKNIRYDEPEQNFMEIGRGYEAQKKYGEALAYFEKALEINPNFEEARIASVAMRNRFWSTTIEGPQSEMEKKQDLYDAWGKGAGLEERIKTSIQRTQTGLREGVGLTLAKKGDWVRISQVFSKKDAALAGLKRGDRLIAIDGESLRYVSSEVVAQKMMSPRFSSYSLEYERDCFLRRGAGSSRGSLGFELKLEYRGPVIKKVDPSSPAQTAGVKKEDALVAVDGEETRYLRLDQIMKKIEVSRKNSLALTVRRSAFLTRR